MPPTHSYSTVEERIGQIRGMLEPLPGQIKEIYERLNVKDKWCVQAENDIRSIQSTLKDALDAIEDVNNSLPDIDEASCLECQGLIPKVSTLWTDLEERKEQKKQAKTDKRSFMSYTGDKLVTVAISLLIAYLLLRLGLQ